MLKTFYDLIIIGAGPAGLSAGIYGGRAKLNTLVIEKGNVGGRAYTTRNIVNYPGVNEISGPELGALMREHAEKFGVVFSNECINEVNLIDDIKIVKTRKQIYKAPVVIIASGTVSRNLGIPGEKEFTGSGVAYCANCDAEFFKDQHVVVIGSGDQAIEESMYIAKFASKVTIIVIHDEYLLDCNKHSAEKAFENKKINFIWNSVIIEIFGEENVQGVIIKNVKSGNNEKIYCEGVFFFVGLIPQTTFLQNMPIRKNHRGYIVTNELMETNLEGVYAIGDVREKFLRQISTAVNDGAIAATAAERFIEERLEFIKSIEQSKETIYLCFWSSEIPNSIDGLMFFQKTKKNMKFIEIDYARKKRLAYRYNIKVDEFNLAVLITIRYGKKISEEVYTVNQQ